MSERLERRLILAVLCGGAFAALAEYNTLDHTLHGGHLFWIGTGIGAALTLLFTCLPVPGLDPETRSFHTLWLFIGLTLLGASGACFVNTRFSPSHPTQMTVEVLHTWSIVDRRSGIRSCWISVSRSDADELAVPCALSDTLQAHSMLKLTIEPGRLGFPFIIGFGAYPAVR